MWCAVAVMLVTSKADSIIAAIREFFIPEFPSICLVVSSNRRNAQAPA
jgi:hypothetical protein